VKIVYLLASPMISGGGKVIFQQADELGRRGHRVTIVCPDPAPEWYSLRHARYERSRFEDSASIPAAEVSIATFWTTIGPALARSSGEIFHLCQGLETDSAFYAPRREEIEAAYRRIPRKIVVSPHLRRFLEDLGYPDVVDVGESFDAEEFRVGRRRFDRSPLRVLLAGVFEIDIKGVAESLEAVRRLRAEGADLRLVRVSPEPVSARERRFQVVDEYHCALSPRRMPELMASVDVFLGPNHAVEGFGLPSLEAMAAGLPCALSDTPSHRAIAGDEAIFFAPGEAGEIARAVSRLLREPETRRRLSAEGPARAARYRTSDVGDRLEGLFRSAVASRS
jgi:glycosyltransferase involved in cell wall biosynthesis